MADKNAIMQFLLTHFPQAPIEVDSVEPMKANVRFRVSEKSLRPGGSVSGPVMMTLADTALYVAILGTIGIVPMAVTTNLNINFLRMPSAGKDLTAQCQLLKVGEKLAIGEVSLYSDGETDMVAHATGTYAIPPKHKR